MKTRTRRNWQGAGAVTLAGLLAVAGCEKPAIEEQRVPKGSGDAAAGVAPAPPAASPAPTEASGPAAGEAPLTAQTPVSPASDWPWKAPETWTLVPGERPMRLATYRMDGPHGPLEVAISRFPGDVGGMLANVNRWRGQVGLGPATEADLAGMIEPFENPGFKGSLLHIEGAEQHIVVASIYESDANQTWTVRVSGTPEVAEAAKAEVFAFARTFGASR